jgi:precorrin-8X/cobalt-precorrin-8 methylmutase
MRHEFETDGTAIYRQSFAIIRAEASLARFNPIEELVVVRMVHATGMVGLETHVQFSEGMAEAARTALEGGAPILCDVRMVSEGITRSRLPAHNEVICTLNDPTVRELAQSMGTTRSAAALELWRPHLAGAVVAIGNAPTALFHLLNMLQDPACPRPAAIIGCPVGFIGAAESKAALMADLPVPALVVQGRLGGSAITVAAVNALACRREI